MKQTTVVKIFLIVMVVLHIIGTSCGLMREKKQLDEAKLEGLKCEQLKEALENRFGEEKWLKFLIARIEKVKCE